MNQATLAKLFFWPARDPYKLFHSKSEPILVTQCWMLYGRGSEQVLPKQLLIQELLCMDRPESALQVCDPWLVFQSLIQATDKYQTKNSKSRAQDKYFQSQT